MAHNRCTRRELLQAGGATLALPLLVPSHALGLGAEPGANDTVNVAIIGLGGRARDIAGTCCATPGIRIVAVCDAFYPRCGAFIKDFADKAKWEAAAKWGAYDDFRQMIDKEKLDAVMVETTTHARAWIAIHAMQAGHGRVHREADVPDHRRGPGHGQGRAEATTASPRSAPSSGRCRSTTGPATW